MKRKMSVVSIVVFMFAMMGAYPALADLDITLTNASDASDGRCKFDFKVTNLKDDTLGKFYVDVEDGQNSAEADLEVTAPPGWEAEFCYPHDGNGWAIICYMASPGNEIPVGGMLDGFSMKTNLNFRDFFPPGDTKEIPGNCTHITWTNDTPMGLGVNCADGDFGPHKPDGGDWDPAGPMGTHFNGGTEWCWELPIPTVSEWSLIVMTVLGMTTGTILFGRRRRRAAV